MDYINIIKNHLLDILEFQQNLDADLDFDLKDSELKSFHEAFKKQKKETKIKILELKMCIKFLNTIKYPKVSDGKNKNFV